MTSAPTSLDAIFAVLAAHVDLHRSAAYSADLGKLAASHGMVTKDQSGGFDISIAWRIVRDKRKLELGYNLFEDGGATRHRYCLALSGGKAPAKTREWNFDEPIAGN